MRPENPFHLAFPVSDLEATRRFYVEVLGCAVGRESDRWIDFDLRGHQISAHWVPESTPMPTNDVEGHQVPVFHFGLVLAWEEWEAMRERLEQTDVRFVIQPHVRFQGQPGEQATFFILDPSGNGLEFKAFRRPEECFQG